MSIRCTLSCASPNQIIELPLLDHLPNVSSVDFSKNATVFEDGRYQIHLSCDLYNRIEVEAIEVCVNGEKVGILMMNDRVNTIDGDVNYVEDVLVEQPFLLRYDLVMLSFVFVFSDETSKEYYSDYLLCVSKNDEDLINIQRMVRELVEFDDSQVGEWLFSEHKKSETNSLYLGKWNKRSYKSLSSYIQLLEKVYSCYKSNFAYFKTHGKHTIKRSSALVSYDKVKTVSRDSFNWIVQNSDQLAQVPFKSGVQIQRRHYLPYQIQTNVSIRSWDVYENRIVISFLHTVLLSAKQVYEEFDKDILNEQRIISRIHGSFPKEYHAPIITIKSLHVSFCRVLLDRMKNSIESLREIYNQYMTLFDVPASVLSSFPRKTSTFCEIKPYAHVFEMISYWFNYGEYSLEKERLILQVKTLDKLFEYYCLLRLLQLLAENGFQKASLEKPVFKYTYTLADEYYQNERDVANTYILSNNESTVTLYFQPVVSAVGFENNLSLYRTTKPYNSPDYYTPDFILKFSSSNHGDEYIIIDSKFSSRKTIRKNYLPVVIRKYSCEIDTVDEKQLVKMIWILQGRVKKEEAPIWRYHNSPLANMYHPHTFYGIVSINTANSAVDVNQRLWNEIKSHIAIL